MPLNYSPMSLAIFCIHHCDHNCFVRFFSCKITTGCNTLILSLLPVIQVPPPPISGICAMSLFCGGGVLFRLITSMGLQGVHFVWWSVFYKQNTVGIGESKLWILAQRSMAPVDIDPGSIGSWALKIPQRVK